MHITATGTMTSIITLITVGEIECLETMQSMDRLVASEVTPLMYSKKQRSWKNRAYEHTCSFKHLDEDCCPFHVKRNSDGCDLDEIDVDLKQNIEVAL